MGMKRWLMSLTHHVLCYQSQRRRLHTNILSKLKKSFLKDISPAIELGRTFIVKEYQYAEREKKS